MYQFLKSFIPSKEEERKQQAVRENLNDTVLEAQNYIESEDIEFELSLAINKTSAQLNKLEKERDELFQKSDKLEKQLKLLAKEKLTEEQSTQRDKLEKHLHTNVKPTLLTMDKEIDELTRKMFKLYNKRDVVSQKKVYASDGVDQAAKIQPLENTEVLSGADNNNNNNSNTTPGGEYV
eukprot:gene2310-2849_t